MLGPRIVSGEENESTASLAIMSSNTQWGKNLRLWPHIVENGESCQRLGMQVESSAIVSTENISRNIFS